MAIRRARKNPLLYALAWLINTWLVRCLLAGPIIYLVLAARQLNPADPSQIWIAAGLAGVAILWIINAARAYERRHISPPKFAPPTGFSEMDRPSAKRRRKSRKGKQSSNGGGGQSGEEWLRPQRAAVVVKPVRDIHRIDARVMIQKLPQQLQILMRVARVKRRKRL